ncbi:MAG: sensor histidine kinase [Acidobacteriia bacterium]|nr:sensor histidine kinase [Terriglobia bacterium]
MAGAFRRGIRTFLSPLSDENLAQRFTVATLAGVLAIILRWVLDPVLGHVAFYVTVFMAVAYCALVCGYAPATLTALLGFVGIFYWFVDPRHSLLPTRPAEIHGVVGFFLVSTVLVALGEANRNKQLRLNQTIVTLTAEIRERQQAQRDLRAAHDQLEQRVQERTHELFEALEHLQAEISVRERTEEELRRLSLRLMSVQDDERRHIARELHDTAGQTLAAMKMSIALIRQIEKPRPELQVLIDDLNALADAALQEVRTTSYLLHPPLLDEAGIASAARWFTEGFARRSGIEIRCEIPTNLERLSRDCELVLFRILQESLTNVHRHSEASAAWVRLERDAEQLQLEIGDNGKGIDESRLRCLVMSGANAGVGIAGMRERVRQLGGRLEVHSTGTGTTVHVILPLLESIRSSSSNAVSVSQ